MRLATSASLIRSLINAAARAIPLGPDSSLQRLSFYRRGLTRIVVLVAILSSAVVSPAEDRAAWNTSRVIGAPTPPLPYRTKRVFGSHVFKQPVEFTNAPGSESMFLLEQTGKIFELLSEDSAKVPILIAELGKHASNFQMAYGLAFHPQFEENRQVYVCYKRGGNQKIGSVVSRFEMTRTDPMRIVVDSEQILYTWQAGGHNGGCVKFGPDGYLYVSAGDAAAPFPPDPLKAGQDLSNLLSTVVRIDVDGSTAARPYRIPRDNPFVDLAGARPEIFAYGFRNPWRMAFDRESGQLWLGDVGWELWEMVHRVEAGGNYGWSIVEGPHDVNAGGARGPTPIEKPAASHPHSEARSITGGQVYYGTRIAELRGAYIYGDHVTGRIWSLRERDGSFDKPQEIARSPLQIICFGLHNNGEIYIVDYAGTIHTLVANQQDEANGEFPTRLSATGIFDSVKDHTLSSGVLPYEIVAEPWMDGATAERFIAIPGQKRIGVYKQGGGHAGWDGKHRGSWRYPANSVLGKTISLSGRRIETQLMHFDGQAWQPYTYLWNEAQTDANLAADESRTIEVKVGGQNRVWQIYNRGDCMVCHTNANDMLLGFKPNQIRRPCNDADDQLDYFEHIKLFEESPPKTPVLVSPHREDANLEAKARSYLHVNCSHCHRPEGGGNGAIDLRFGLSRERSRMVDQVPLQGTLGLPDARVVAPGAPFQSVLLYRFCKLGPGHMPKMGGFEVDHLGAKLLHDWIASLAPHNAENTLQETLAALNRKAQEGSNLIAWLSDPFNSLATTHALRNELIPPETREQLLAASRRLPAATRDLFESFIPYAERTKRVGSNTSAQEILAERGDAQRGRELFYSSSLSCKNCHSVEPMQLSVGPNLGELPIAQYQRDRLLGNILQPSKEIKPEYHTHTIHTDEGEIITGVVQSEGKTVVIRDAQNKVHQIAASAIEFRKAADVSLMPEKLLEPLTLQQARDLIEFLAQLRQR